MNSVDKMADVHEFLSDCGTIPAIAAISGSAVATVFIVKNIRPYFKVQVNCWFCNTNFKVPFSQKNSFVCQNCQQYNGFNKDGSYNKDISALKYPSLNPTFKTNKGKNVKDVPKSEGLCKSCNLHQAIKVQSLAKFVPYSEENYDSEIQAYKQQLEKTYRLCRSCEAKLHQEIGKQNSWLKPKLITWRLHQSKAQMLQAASDLNKQPFVWKLFSVMLVLISLSLFATSCVKINVLPQKYITSTPQGTAAYSFIRSNFELGSTIGLLVLLLMLFGRGKNALVVADIMCCLAWICLITLTSCKKYFSTSSYAMTGLGLHLGTLIFTLWMAATPRFSRTSRRRNKENSFLNRSVDEYSQSSLVDETLGEDQELSISSPSPVPSNNGAGPPKATSPPAEVITNNVPKNGLDSFGCLKIGTPRKSPSDVSARSIFSERPPSKLLADPKLTSSVTQASWVAGGYWGSKQSPQKVPGRQHAMIGRGSPQDLNASRASSQSSGFGSRDSGLPCTFDDKASMTSDGLLGSWPSQPSHRRFDSPSGCGVSYLSDRPPSPVHSCDSILNNSRATSQSIIHEELHKMYTTGSPLLPKWSPWVAFFLGVSVTANVFLALGFMKS